MVGNEPAENISKRRAFSVRGNDLAVSEGCSDRMKLKSTLNLTRSLVITGGLW